MAGVHSSYCAVGTMFLLVHVLATQDATPYVLSGAVLLLGTALICAVFEMCIASTHHAGVGLQRLLEDGSDGFCSIGFKNCEVSSPSSKFDDLCGGGQSAAGICFAEILRETDKQIFDVFLTDAMNGHMGSILVTFHLPTMCKCDCKIADMSQFFSE